MTSTPLAHKLAFLGTLVVALAIPIENTFTIPGIGSLSRLAGVLLLATAVPTFLTPGALSVRKPTLVMLLLGLFVLWAMTGLLWTIDTRETLRYVLTFAQLLILVFLVWQVCTSERARLALQRAYVIGCYIAILDGLRNFLVGQEAVFRRYAVSNTDPNDYALILAFAIPMAWELFARSRHWSRVFYALFFPLALAAVVLSASRGGALAAAVGFLVIPLGFFSLDRGGKRILLALLAGLAMLVPFAWDEVSEAVGSNIERIGTFGQELKTGTLNERTELWALAMATVSNHPLTGVGGGAFATAVEQATGNRDLVHNTFLSVTVETGAVGLTIFLAIFIVILIPLARSGGPGMVPSLVLYLTLVVGLMPLTWEFRKPLWLVVALLLSVRSVQLERIRPAPVARSMPAGQPTTAPAYGMERYKDA